MQMKDACSWPLAGALLVRSPSRAYSKQISPKERSQGSFGEAHYEREKMKKSRLLVCVDTLCKDQFSFLASPSGKMILFTKKKMTMEMPPLSTVVPML